MSEAAGDNGATRWGSAGARMPPGRERRQLTVLFVDIVGSTALSKGLDPEELYAILREYREICERPIERFGGVIGGSFGDGLLAYFGFPAAHEDDAERAVHAALALAASVASRDFATASGPRRLSVRVAANTGLALVDRMRSGSIVPGEISGTTAHVAAAHVAARLQSVAGANEVVVGRTTYELVRGAFNCTYLGEQSLKGVSGPVAAWRVDGVRDSEGRFERSRTSPLTPMVGRIGELEKLQEMWRASTQGGGCAAFISGDPGIGKSRLIQDLRQSLAAEAKETLYFQCSPLHVNTPLAPEIERIRRAAAIQETDTASEMVAKLRSLLRRARSDVDQAVPYYGAVLSIPACDGYEPADLGSARERDRALETMIETTLAAALRMPVLVIVEDAQWIDPTSAELIERLVARLAGTRVFLVVTHRSDWIAPWRASDNVAVLTLTRLAPDECEQMVKLAAGNAAFPRSVVAKIVQRTDGVPLYIEEFTRAVVDSGVLAAGEGESVEGGPPPRLPEPMVPATIKDSLMERLDRLGSAKHIAQVAAVFGRAFSSEALHCLTGMPSNRLCAVIGTLEARGLLRRSGKTDEKLVFGHAMIQELAYESLLKDERRALHAAAARWLRSRPERHSGHFAELGYHYARAGLAREAVVSWLEAGKSALMRAANREAIASLQEGLELIPGVPPSPERCRDEIELQLNLALAYTGLAGWHFSAVDRAYSRALELCRECGTAQQKYVAFWGLTIAKTVSCELDKALAFAEEFVALAMQRGDEDAILMAHTAALIANFFLGRLPEAEAAAQHVLARYDPRRHRGLVEIYQHDPKIVALIWSGHIEWILGRPQRARDCCEEARSYARVLGHPFMLALALILGASDHLYQHDLAANLATVEEGIALAREHGFRIYEYFGPLWAIEAVAARGPTRLRLEDLTALVSRLLEKKCYLQAPLYQIWLAEAWAGIDEVERARALAAAAEALMLRTGERWFEPELYRIRAMLLSQGRRRSVSAARELFLRSIASARDLKAPGWELRAAIGLARLLDSEGDGAEAERLLAEVRGKFAAHERSTDLGAADELLQSLRRRVHERSGRVVALP